MFHWGVVNHSAPDWYHSEIQWHDACSSLHSMALRRM
jgi:hypothetical protein